LKIGTAAIACFATIYLAGVGSAVPADELARLEFKKISPSLENYGYVSRNHLWHAEIISVCWDNPAVVTTQDRLVVEEAVEKSWEIYAHLSFTGWGSTCTQSTRGVHIFVADESPRSLIGTRLDGVARGVRLNVTFQQWGKSYCGAPGNREGCIRTVAMHEFGHVLGLIHESLRSDAPPTCKDSAAVTQDDSDPGDGDERTPYDSASIMNYCNLIYGKQSTLSSLDKIVAKTMYPSPGE
jgi:hypothetical protein